MIGIADAKLLNLGMGLLSKWNGLILFIYRELVDHYIITYSNLGRNQHTCVLLPVTLPQPGLDRIAEQVQVYKY